MEGENHRMDSTKSCHREGEEDDVNHPSSLVSLPSSKCKLHRSNPSDIGETKHRTEENRWRQRKDGCGLGLSMVLVIFLFLPSFAVANTPPRFLLEGGENAVGGDIVVRLKEGPGTPPGTRILQLRGYDRDGDELTFDVVGPEAQQLFRIENHHNNEASVYLNQVLDAESTDEYQFILTLTDGNLGEGNFITQSMLLLVEDINDNPPVFMPYPHTVSVEEHSGVNVITTVEARDRDSGIFGQVVYDLREENGFDDYFHIDTIDGQGVISVVNDLDYEEKNVFQLQVLAMDRANFGQVNTATAAILVKVVDVADQPPVFTRVPSVTRIAEDVPRFSEVSVILIHVMIEGRFRCKIAIRAFSSLFTCEKGNMRKEILIVNANNIRENCILQSPFVFNLTPLEAPCTFAKFPYKMGYFSTRLTTSNKHKGTIKLLLTEDGVKVKAQTVKNLQLISQ